MNNEALIDLLRDLTQAKTFLVEQAPSFCQELIARGITMPLYTGCAFTLIALVWAAWVVFSLKFLKKDEDLEAFSFLATITGLFAIFSLLAALVNFHKALAVYIAPKVYLVEEITRMLK